MSERLRECIREESMSLVEQRVQNARHACVDEIDMRKRCTLSHAGDECIKEQLAEKRCLAYQLCPMEAQVFYMKRTSHEEDGVSCSAMLERFAFQQDMYPRSQVTPASVDQRRKCRAMNYRLTKCLASHNLTPDNK